jgi:4-hydroxy-3-methylbut-2-enyl diphosphate reductase
MTLLVYAPLRIEAQTVAPGLPRARVVRSGMGPLRAHRAAAGLWRDTGPDDPVAIAGFAGALREGLAPGDIVIADEVRGGSRVVRCPSAAPLAAALRRLGLRVHVGPILTVESAVRRQEHRAELAETGAIAIDMESAAFLDLVGDRPRAVLRVIVDGPDRPLVHPRTITGGVVARRALRRAAPALQTWADACSPRKVLLAGPRSFCAGVERAIAIVEAALERYGEPVYVRKQIVHNIHVVRDLEQRGAIFVDEVDEVPDGATLVFSAHGVSPQVRAEAGARGLQVIDATCPLVSKVHAEARRFAARGETIALIGHRGHEEVEGTTGEAPEAVRLVESAEDVETLEVEDPERISYLMQTTLAVDESQHVVDALRRRFPALRGPSSDDICYATTNRQAAIRAVARESDAVLVVGSANSSNSRRLVEIAARECGEAHLVDDDGDIDLGWLAGRRTIGLTAGASAPPDLVERVITALAGLGPVEVAERPVVTESVEFSLPKEVSRP